MGSKVSEHVTKKFNATSNRLFRPLSGNKVSEPKREVTLWSQRKSFRPLSGSKVSELLLIVMWTFILGFSSPLGE